MSMLRTIVRVLAIAGAAAVGILMEPSAVAQTPGQDAFRYTLFIARPAPEVWNALTSKRIVDQYYLAPLGEDINSLSQDFYYGSEENKVILGQVLDYRENERLVHSFRFSHEPEAAKTVVTFELDAIGEMSALHLTHDGFEGETQTYHDIAGGWPVILSNLKTLLETGAPLPWPTGD